MAAAIAAGASVAALALPGSEADAARRTDSATIASEADAAVAALERWTQTDNPIDYVRYVQQRDATAELTERDIEIGADALRDAWSEAPIAKQHTVLSAMSQLGVPYRYLASEPGVAFDCSGLTIWAFGRAGVEIPRVSRDQINASIETERDAAEPGDLVYYPGHVSIYLGAETMIHSPNSGSTVEVAPLPERSLRFGDAAATSPDVADTALTDTALTDTALTDVVDVVAGSPADASLVDGAISVAE